MKKFTKLVLGMAAAIVAGTFIGCAMEEGETGKFGEDFALTNNSETGYKRGYKTTRLKHTSAVAKITLPEASGVESDGDGVVGFIFHVVENGDGSNTFGLIGLRRNADDKVQYYISYYENVNVTDHLNDKANFCDMSGKKIGETGCTAKEAEIVKGNSTPYADLTTASSGDCVLYVELLAGGNDTDGDGKVEDDEGDGSYKVNIYKASDWNESENKPKANTTALAKDKTIANTYTKDSVATQYKLGLYTNAYNGCTLKGRMDIVDTINECEIEFED